MAACCLSKHRVGIILRDNMSYSIISYNVNGIRSAANKGLMDWLTTVNPDIICFQELKAMPTDLKPEVHSPQGYNSYWFPAEKKGYSGVAVYSKIEPQNVVYGSGMEQYDREGRFIRLDFPEFSLLNVYVPSGSSGEERQGFKEVFMNDFYEYVRGLLQEVPKLVICGDINICHQEIDIHNPVSNKNSSGFLPHEREWLSKFLQLGFKDTFRMHNSDPHQYSWWSFRFKSREQNKGWRIDYHLVAECLAPNVADAKILQDAVHSDHAPIYLKLQF
jgi:exodeoxyribonuclease-3